MFDEIHEVVDFSVKRRMSVMAVEMMVVVVVVVVGGQGVAPTRLVRAAVSVGTRTAR